MREHEEKKSKKEDEAKLSREEEKNRQSNKSDSAIKYRVDKWLLRPDFLFLCVLV